MEPTNTISTEGRCFLSSDWHIGHTKLSTDWRHFDTVEDHTEWVIQTVNDTVGGDDTLYLLGDSVMGQFKENVQHLGRIRCRNINLIPGNHDRIHPCYWGPKKIHRIPEFAETYSQYVDICDLQVQLDEFLLCHFPYRGLVNEDRESGNRYEEYWPEDDGESVLLHGHLHSQNNGLPHHPRMLDVGLDNFGCPVSLDEIREIFDGYSN